MQQDTLFGELNQPLTQNLYIYCLNNGVNLRDPSGNSSVAELQAQYDRAQRAGAGQSVLDEIKKAIESKRSSSSGSAPTQAQAQEAARKAEEAKRKAREAAAKAAAAGVTGTQLDQMLAQGNISPPPTWGSGSGNSSSNLNGGNNGDIPHGGISGKFDETATKRIASSKYGDYFDDKIKVASPVMGLGVAVSQFDTPLLGPADAVGGLIILGALGTASTIALIDYLTGKPIIFDDKVKGHDTESPDDDRVTNPPKGESEVWKNLDNVKGSDKKTSGAGKNKKYYGWDNTHNDIEVYNNKGGHLGSMDPTTGKMYKPPVPGRTMK